MSPKWKKRNRLRRKLLKVSNYITVNIAAVVLYSGCEITGIGVNVFKGLELPYSISVWMLLL